jgi:fermentation-respiration switch protein FrsA (DUF1100 family)
MIKRVLFILGASVLIFSLSVSYVIYLMIVRPVLAPKFELTDHDYKEFLAKTIDGIDIKAAFYEGKPESGLIILCHGHGVNLGQMNSLVGFLRGRGYSLLLPDFRAHGESGGTYCTVGLDEWKDLKAVIAQAKKLGHISETTRIAAYGRSMGAATLINGSENLPEIEAFILESSFERLRKIAGRDAWSTLKIPDTFVTDIFFFLIDKITGISYSSNNPVENVDGFGSRPVFLIHDELDKRANGDAFLALKSRMPGAKTWVVKGARHVQAHNKEPEEFERRFLKFLDELNFPCEN